MSNYVALLRGVNVGGKNKLPMKDLVRIFQDAGCTEVQTYIQSGNVIFQAKEPLATKLAAIITKEIELSLGPRVPVVLRSGVQLNQAIAGNPYLKEDGVNEDFLYMGFLAGEPKQPEKLDAHRSPGDRFVVKGQEIYMHLPNGAGNSKLTNAWLDSRLKTISTFRNWRTVLRLRDLMG